MRFVANLEKMMRAKAHERDSERAAFGRRNVG